jgi:hypothetical protein
MLNAIWSDVISFLCLHSSYLSFGLVWILSLYISFVCPCSECSNSTSLWYQNVMWVETRNYKLCYSLWFPSLLAKFIWDVNGACSFTRSVTCASPLSPAKNLGAVKVVYDCLFQGYKVELETNWSFFYSDSTFLCILLNNRNFRLVWANVGILSMHSFYFGVYIAQAGILDCSMY